MFFKPSFCFVDVVELEINPGSKIVIVVMHMFSFVLCLSKMMTGAGRVPCSFF